MSSGYQVLIHLVRYDYRGDRDEKQTIVATESSGQEIEAVVANTITKFRKMLDVEQESSPESEEKKA